jgi:5-methylcytosine-specific restriction protein A
MNTFLLTWNPDRWNWKNLDATIARVKRTRFCPDQWTCRTSKILPGDRVFLLRQGHEPRGIMAAGEASSARLPGAHYSSPRKKSTYVRLRWDSLFAEPILPRARLSRNDLAGMHWNIMCSGVEIPPRIAARLEQIWYECLSAEGFSPVKLPDEIVAPGQFLEGAVRRVTVNAYERDPQARRACIQHHGTNCHGCVFSFAAHYGDIGNGFIHVHHLRPLASVGVRYTVDPIADLRPVCPNCHAMIHQQDPALSIKELKSRLQRLRKTR